ncbi:uncharacterized protein LOC110012390 [Sesamum indicum]|uniref:Uncharacterized protein LOC110012390 n=1 Tax=Sesamum indicum TaxID=4182 RepID=A0A8M8V5J9_SESIN|nr:uncharacterized protein LOC110012390 [Sesamum indicum]
MGALETGNAEVKCKHSSEMEPTKERKRVKVSMQDIATQGLESTSSAAVETSSVKKMGRKYNRKEKDVKKSTGPRKNATSKSKTGSADQIDYQAPPKKFTATQKSSDEEGCPASTLKSEPHTGPEVKEYCDSLKARVADLRQETFMLSCQLQKRANKCMKLRDANRLLMDELKKMCEQFVIDILEAKNPDNALQTE